MTDDTVGLRTAAGEEPEFSPSPEDTSPIAPSRSRTSRRGRQPLGFEIAVPLAHEATIARLTGALKAQGFGILTRVDLHTTLAESLGVTLRPYSLLGVCHPRLAYRAILLRAESGLLLPCRITVEAGPSSGSVIRIADPRALLAGVGLETDAELLELASEARSRLRRVADELTRHPTLTIL